MGHGPRPAALLAGLTETASGLMLVPGFWPSRRAGAAGVMLSAIAGPACWTGLPLPGMAAAAALA